LAQGLVGRGGVGSPLAARWADAPAMSRVFVSAGAGRERHTRGSTTEEEIPWGVSASQSHYKGFEASEAQGLRGQQATSANQWASPETAASTRRAHSQIGSAHSRSLPDLRQTLPDLRAPGSAVGGASVASGRASRVSGASGKASSVKAASRVWTPSGRNQPMPENPFYESTHMQDHQAMAEQSRATFQGFPYRDEYAPRSKRLLYEMALAKQVEEDTKSEVSGAASMSCFTVASSRGARGSVAASSRGGGLASVPEGRLHTADSQRVPGGIAKRRLQAFYKAPAQWEADHQWVLEKLEKDGPAGLAYNNYKPSMCMPTFKNDREHMRVVHALMGGRNETAARAKPGQK